MDEGPDRLLQGGAPGPNEKQLTRLTLTTALWSGSRAHGPNRTYLALCSGTFQAGLGEPWSQACTSAITPRRFWEERGLPWKRLKAGAGASQRWDLGPRVTQLSYPHLSHLPSPSAQRWWLLSSRTHPSQPQDPLTSPFPKFLPTSFLV